MSEQYQEQKQKRKQKKKEEKLEFEIGKVFGPEAAKEEDFALDVDMARYKAQQGQGGDRGSGDGPEGYTAQRVIDSSTREVYEDIIKPLLGRGRNGP